MITQIKNETDYKAALAEIEPLMSTKANSPEMDKLKVLVALVEDYEAKHYPITMFDD